jgi:DNA-binding response OmpR family regulator
MSALIILVSANARTLRHTEAVLSERGYLVAALSSVGEANGLLDSVTPDLLIADLRPGVDADLQIAIRSRLDHPDVPVIVTSLTSDAIVEREAHRAGAAFVVAPLDNETFVPSVDAAIEKRRREQPPVRRWFRAPAPRDVEVRAGQARAQIVDISYGGVRLAFRAPCEIPSTFDISIPSTGVAVKAQRVWTARSATGEYYWCGAALVDGVDAPWRAFINSLRADGDS